MASKAVAVLAAVLLVAAAATSGGGGAGVASAQQCDAGQLAVCAPAIIGGAAPTTECCTNLHSQEPCLCQYAHNPAYGSYVNSPNARKTLTSCNIAVPHC